MTITILQYYNITITMFIIMILQYYYNNIKITILHYYNNHITILQHISITMFIITILL